MTVTFYGSSFITDPMGDLLADADRTTQGVFTAQVDFDEIRNFRTGWGFYRDRRPKHYRILQTLDGTTPAD